MVLLMNRKKKKKELNAKTKLLCRKIDKKKGRNNLDFFASEFLQNIQEKGEQGFNHSSETASGGVL